MTKRYEVRVEGTGNRGGLVQKFTQITKVTLDESGTLLLIVQPVGSMQPEVVTGFARGEWATFYMTEVEEA